MFLSRVTRETKVYWRKANAIHAYIVDNHAIHGDDCTPIELDRDSIEELRDRYGVGVAIVELDQHLDYSIVAENDVFRVYDLSMPFGDAQARSNGVD